MHTLRTISKENCPILISRDPGWLSSMPVHTGRLSCFLPPFSVFGSASCRCASMLIGMCVHVCLYACVYMCVYTHTYTCMRIRMCVYTRVCTNEYTSMLMRMIWCECGLKACAMCEMLGKIHIISVTWSKAWLFYARKTWTSHRHQHLWNKHVCAHSADLTHARTRTRTPTRTCRHMHKVTTSSIIFLDQMHPTTTCTKNEAFFASKFSSAWCACLRILRARLHNYAQEATPTCARKQSVHWNKRICSQQEHVCKTLHLSRI